MTVQATYPISLTSQVNEFNPQFVPRGVRIANYSNDNLAFDNSVDPVLLIPPGLNVPIVINHFISTIRVRSATNTTGSATITIMDSEPDVSNVPPLQQLPGTITATIPSAVNITGTVNTIPQGTTPVSGNFIDPNVAANTSALLGLLTRNTSFFSLAAAGIHSETVTNAIVGFGLTSTINGTGRLNIWVVSGATSIYLVRDRGFYSSPLTLNPIEKRFAIPIRAGDSINVSWDDSLIVAAFVLRY